jgi:hypothetical protein
MQLVSVTHGSNEARAAGQSVDISVGIKVSRNCIPFNLICVGRGARLTQSVSRERRKEQEATGSDQRDADVCFEDGGAKSKVCV